MRATPERDTLPASAFVEEILPTSSVNSFPVPDLAVTDPLVGLPQTETPPEPEPVSFPLGWLLSNASGPIQYRAIVDVAKLELPRDPSGLRYTSPTAIALAVSQAPGGSWSDAMLALRARLRSTRPLTLPAARPARPPRSRPRAA